MIEFGAFRYDPESRLLYRGNEEISLPPRLLAVLESFLARPGKLLTKDHILESAWPGTFVGESSIAQAVSQLRQALGDDPQRSTYIQTIPKRGYRLTVEVLSGAGRHAELSPALIRFGPFSWEVATCRLFRDGVEIRQTAKTAAVLGELLKRPGQLIRKDEFLGTVWAGVRVREESLTQAISLIRQALEDSCQRPTYVETVSGEGYRFIGRVTEDARSDTPATAPGSHPDRHRPTRWVAGAALHRPGWPAARAVSIALAAGLALLIGSARPGRLTNGGAFAVEGLPLPTSLNLSSRLSPDGNRVSWVDYDRREVMVLDRSDGEVSAVVDLESTGTIVGPALWSRDGGRLAYWHVIAMHGTAWPRSELHVVDVHSAKDTVAVALSGLLHVSVIEGSFDWSPDETHVIATVSTRGGPTLVEIGLADGTSTTLLEGHVRNARYSPDGETIAYSMEVNTRPRKVVWQSQGQAALFIRSRDGTRTARISDSGFYKDDFPIWSPDGRYLLFSRSRGYLAAELYAIAVDGFGRFSEPFPVYRELIGTAVPVSWALGGELMFQVDPGYSLQTLEVDPVTLRPRGEPTANRDPTRELSNGLRTVAYAPESNSLAVLAPRSIGSRLHPVLYFFSGGVVKPLQRPADVVMGRLLGFLPDGSEVLHADVYEDGTARLFRTEVTTLRSEELPVPDIGTRWMPLGPSSLSPTGSHYFFGSGGYGVGLASVDGRVLERRIPDLRSACWSPDGTEFAGFFNERLGTGIVELRRARVGQRDSVALRKFDWKAGIPSNPIWSPDGRYIAYVLGDPNRERGVVEIQAIPADGGEPVVMLRSEDGTRSINAPRWIPDGSAISFLKREQPGLYVMRNFLPGR